MLVYVHVPFCRSKCAYCGFHSEPMDLDRVEPYVRAVVREITIQGKRFATPKAKTVYFGGGTPSLLPGWALEGIMRALHDHFIITPQTEFTFEANPESVDGMLLQELRRFGVNRLSLGIQSLDDLTLQFLGRVHTARQAVAAFEAARDAGFRNISLDFIWGIPGQRPSAWRNQLKYVAETMKPEHLSCYGLTLEEDTRLMRGYEKGEFNLPSEDDQSSMFIYGARFLEEYGFMHYEISNFAKMGFNSRHNTGYWEGRDYLGFGPSAVSTVLGRRWENPRNLELYTRRVDSDTLLRDAEELSEQARLDEFIMLSLRTSRGLDLKQYKTRSGVDFMERHRQTVEALHKHGLVKLKHSRLRLTPNGMLVSNAILEHFLGTR